jgi:hypothetical protein
VPIASAPSGRRTLARYRLAGEPPAVTSARVGARVQILDEPLGGEGEALLVDSVPLSRARIARALARSSGGQARAGRGRAVSRAGRAGAQATRPAPRAPIAKEPKMATATLDRLAKGAPARRRRRRAERVLGAYLDAHGHAHAILAIKGARGTLVVDRREGLDPELRVIATLDQEDARLALDRSRDQAQHVASLYVADKARGRCRLLCAEDLRAPSPNGAPPAIDPFAAIGAGKARYRIAPLASRHEGRRALRWRRICADGRPGRVATLREVVGALESYEPARAMTLAAIAGTRQAGSDGERVSVCTLANELRNLERSSLVLNTGVREAAQRMVARGELTWAQIAHRCGQCAHKQGGDSTWVQRRLGLKPDGGALTTSPWTLHSVLARIAREGLGLDPNSLGL